MFKFNKEEHYYELDGKRLYGVTTILQVIAKPALIPWAVKTCVDYIKTNCPMNEDYYSVTDLDLDNAKSAHRKKKEDAGVKGTSAHEIIEELVKYVIDNRGGFFSAYEESDNQQVKNFIKWARDNSVKFLASEKQLYSELMWCAGTTDLVLEIKGKKYIGDVKTSSAIYPEHFYQMAGYRAMLEEMGETGFDGSVVIRIGKDGKFNEDKDVQYRYDYKTDLNAFLGALAIFKAGETYKVK